MANHEYNAQRAFEVLMRKLQERDATLAAQVQGAVDTGKDVEETESFGTGRKRYRIYRKTVPYNYEEALQVALNALAAYFVEQPLFVNSFLDDMAAAALEVGGHAKRSLPVDKMQPVVVRLETKGTEKLTEIELRTETQISRGTEETFALHRLPPDEVTAQLRHLDHLRALVTFGNR